MPYNVVFQQSAIDMLNRMDKPVRVRLYKWIKKNLSGTEDPRAKGRAMVGSKKGYWRYRVGDYRLIVLIEDLEIRIYCCCCRS